MNLIHQPRAIDGVCAWPNLTLLPDGSIIATIFNQPCHGTWQGDLDCYGSEDGGLTWQFRGRPGVHEGETNRMNCAVGLANNGDLLVLVSGWSYRDVPGNPRNHQGEARKLRARICRSSDYGRTWVVTGELPDTGPHPAHVPFGDIAVAEDGALCVSTYGWNEDAGRSSALLWRSYDDGYTWNQPVCIEITGNETAILHLGGGRWLAASRIERDVHLDLLSSEDDGHTWNQRGPITEPRQVTGHLLQLKDGQVLLSHGSRIQGDFSVMFRLSEDRGQTWSESQYLDKLPAWDCGYPASVERADGTIVTAYYSQHPERGDYQYQMDVVLWRP